MNAQTTGGYGGESPEADTVEQHRPVAAPPDAQAPTHRELPLEADAADATEHELAAAEAAPGELPLEADPGDVADQRREVPEADEDYLH